MKLGNGLPLGERKSRRSLTQRVSILGDRFTLIFCGKPLYTVVEDHVPAQVSSRKGVPGYGNTLS